MLDLSFVSKITNAGMGSRLSGKYLVKTGVDSGALHGILGADSLCACSNYV